MVGSRSEVFSVPGGGQQYLSLSSSQDIQGARRGLCSYSHGVTGRVRLPAAAVGLVSP